MGKGELPYMHGKASNSLELFFLDVTPRRLESASGRGKGISRGVAEGVLQAAGAPKRYGPAGGMQLYLQSAVDRFKAIKEDEKRREFRDKPCGYIRLYAFLSQIIPNADAEQEMLCDFGRSLPPHLPIDHGPLTITLTDKVACSTTA
ncbi:MAG: hypothetical protein V1816_01080 [Pseudomonadota bacterium]